MEDNQVDHGMASANKQAEVGIKWHRLARHINEERTEIV